MILSKRGSNEIGLKLFSSSVDPALKRAITFAIFSKSGKMPWVKVKLITLQSLIATKSATIFKNWIGMLWGPILFFGRATMMSIISSSEIYAIMKSN